MPSACTATLGHGRETSTSTRVAIYTRKSVTEGLDQQFNTLDAQREAAESYIASQRAQGWAPSLIAMTMAASRGPMSTGPPSNA